MGYEGPIITKTVLKNCFIQEIKKVEGLTFSDL